MNAPNHPRIVIDPSICGGRPTVAGTRVRVTDILGMLAEGVGEAGILADFPYLSVEDVRACLTFAASIAEEGGQTSADGAAAGERIPPGYYTPETLPPLSEGAKAILASVDAVAPLVDVRTEAKRARAAPGIRLEDDGIVGIRLSDEGLPGIDPDR